MMDTSFYRAVEGTQEEFFNKMFAGSFDYRDRIICFNRGEPRIEEDKVTKLYHILDCTVYVNKDSSSKNTITGESREKRFEAKSLMEKITNMKLREINILEGEE